MDTVGSILGPFVAFLILQHWPGAFYRVFLTSFLIGLVALASLGFITEFTSRHSRGQSGSLASFRILPRQFRTYVALIFLLSVGTVPVVVLLLKTQPLGLAIADVPLFYMLYSVSYAALSLPVGQLSDRIGAKRVLVIGYTVLIASYLIIGLAGTSVSLAIGFLVLGCFPALTDGIQRSYAAKITESSVRGQALGWLNAAVGFGGFIAGAGGGYLW